MKVYLVIEHTRDGSMGTTNENVYYTENAFVKKESAIKFLEKLVEERDFKKSDDFNEDDPVYITITYAGSSIEGDADYIELYIEELEVEEE